MALFRSHHKFFYGIILYFFISLNDGTYSPQMRGGGRKRGEMIDGVPFFFMRAKMRCGLQVWDSHAWCTH